jgi:2-polyprenyl-3-methyl-5-hydroxy-6-metoxy-1,4-benzoquinol methylase
VPAPRCHSADRTLNTKARGFPRAFVVFGATGVASTDVTTIGGTQPHWDEVYSTKEPKGVSWFQLVPEVSLKLVESVGDCASAFIDVGAGASTLAEELAGRGWTDLTVLDVSAQALRIRDDRANDPAATTVRSIVSDVLTFKPERAYDIWHDRAVLHFLTDPADVARYVEVAARAIRHGGHLVIGTFAEDGPTQCSDLPTVRYSAESLVAAVGAPFTLVHFEREEHHTPWDSVQPFTWVVLRRT